MRQVLALVSGAAVAALGGLILGEYPFTGATPYVAGVLFALVVAEVILSVSRRGGPGLAIWASVCTAGGLGWAVWISSGRGVAPVPRGGWAAIIIGGVVALLRGAVTRARRPEGDSPPEP